MCVRTAALLLLLVLQLSVSVADRTNDKQNQTPEPRARRHDSEERPYSGRRWTTSRNSPYQKIVSSYEQGEPDVREEGDVAGSDEQDQAKAKSHKRKQWRSSPPQHDQIPSETSSIGESEKAVAGGTAPEAVEVQRTPRRRSTTSHPREPTPEQVEPSTSSPKKRRRPVTPATTTTTLAPQTMSDSLYQYFRPLDQDVPQDDIIPFLDFGRKLSPVIPTPSGANSIENRSSVTKLRPRGHHDEKESNSSDEEVLQEDMDVTVVKKAIERNSVPRGKLRVQSSGISDYYKKRVPSQVRTTENLISTSDSSTASSVPGSKLQNVGVLKKINRHQIHHVQPLKIPEQVSIKLAPELESSSVPKNVEILQEKRRQLLSRPIQRSAAMKQEAPLTAESSLVKTVIKEVPVEGSSEHESQNTTVVPNNTNKTSAHSSSTQNSATEEDSLLNANVEQSKTTNIEAKPNPKILSTAVVTSVSVQESLQDPQHKPITEPPIEGSTINSKPIYSTPVLGQSLPTKEDENASSGELKVQSFISVKNSTNTISLNSSEPVQNRNITTADTKVNLTTTVRNETPLRSRDIYKPKAIPPGTSIPHLPRQIPISKSRGNAHLQTTETPAITSSAVTSENVTKPHLNSTSTISSTKKPLTSTTPSTTTTTSTTTTPEPSTTAATSIATSSPETSSTKVQFIADKLPQELPNKDSWNVTENLNVPIPSEKVTNSNETQTIPVKANERPDTGVVLHEVHSNEDLPLNVEEESSQGVDTESVPPPINEEPVENLTFVPAYSPEDGGEDQFHIYFTTLPTSTVPVVDTRPDTEAAIVEEQKNSSTPRPGAEWEKVSERNKEVEVVYPEAMGLGTYLLAALGVVPIILGALIGARFILAHNRKKVLDESEYSSEYNRSPLGVSTASPLPTKLPRIPTHVSWPERETEKSAPTIAPVPSASARWEFPREKLRLQTLLGQGNFGQVWKAEADDIAGHEGLTRLVAVKTVKESANTREREDLLRELGIMQELGSHPNVVTLLGCCTEKEPIYLMMEYVMYGKLLSFLRDHRTRAHYYNFSDATDALTSRDLTVFGYCVARGMDYLTNKSIIHRDLAARNVLVDHNKLCKIADFGMSRNVRDTGQIYEQRQSKGALPIRWMAPESLHFSLFTHKTDVWSFGILMWEIVTLGSTPYATMGAREVMRRVRDGYRLDRPSHCRPELFRVIARCWHSEPSKRPTFTELKAELGQLLSDSELNGSYVDLDSFADEMRRDTLHRHH